MSAKVNKCYQFASILFLLLSKKMVNTHMLILCMLSSKNKAAHTIKIY